MDKYYITNLGSNLAENGPFKLVTILFARRPPTFGILQLSSNDRIDPKAGSLSLSLKNQKPYSTTAPIGRINKREVGAEEDLVDPQVLRLSCLNAVDEQNSKFETLKEVALDKKERFVHFELLGGSNQILIEGSTRNPSLEQQLESTCLLLTTGGCLIARSLIDGYAEEILSVSRDTRISLNGAKDRQNCDELFLNFASQMVGPPAMIGEQFHGFRSSQTQCQTQQAHSGQQASKQQSTKDLLSYMCQFNLYLLSERCYYLYCVRLRQNNKNYNLEFHSELVSTIHLFNNEQVSLPPNNREKFIHIIPLFTHRPHVVLLRRADGSVSLFNHGKCVHPNLGEYDELKLGCDFISEIDDSQVVILNVNWQLPLIQAHNLLVAELDDHQGQPNNQDDLRRVDNHFNGLDSGLSDNGNGREKSSAYRRPEDPDKLLPAEPSFELEKCWSLNLREEISSLKLLDDMMADDDPNEERDEPSELAGCLCPFWSHNDEKARNNWPKYFLIAYRCHLLVFQFEQESQIPFLTVYDRSFIDFDEQRAPSAPELEGKKDKTRSTKQQEPMGSVMPKVRPKLVHNFKLIGAQAADAMFNFLFLKERNLYIMTMCHYQPLGLVVSLTNMGHLLVFKIHSKRVIKQKHNDFYQQKLVAALGGTGFLLDEVEKLTKNISLLKEHIAKLERQSVELAAAETPDAGTMILLADEPQTERSRSGTPAGISDTLGAKLEGQQSRVKLPENVQRQNFLDTLSQMIDVQLIDSNTINESLAHSSPMGPTYRLSMNWPNLIQIERVLVVFQVPKCAIAWPEGEACKLVKKIHIENRQPLGQFEISKSCATKRFTLSQKLDQRLTEPAFSWALVELEQTRPESVSISLSLVLPDGISNADGQICAYFLLRDPSKMAARSRQSMRPKGSSSKQESKNWRILAAASELAISLYHRRSRSISEPDAPGTLIKKSLPIRPLQSFRYVTKNPSRGDNQASRELGGSAPGSRGDKSTMELELTSSNRRPASVGDRSIRADAVVASWRTFAGWLAECIDHRQWSTELANSFDSESPQKVREVSFRFESSFTACFLEFQLELPASSSSEQDTKIRLKLRSDDFFSLQLVRHHLLRRATEKSIQLEAEKSGPEIGQEHLRYLLQKVVSNLAHRQVFANSKGTMLKLGDGTQSSLRTSSDLIIESLLDEASSQVAQNKLQGSLVSGSSDLALTKDWFERSFRKDVNRMLQEEGQPVSGMEELFSSELHSDSSPSNRVKFAQKDDGLFIFVEYILDVLTEFDAIEDMTSTGERSRRVMLEKLLNLLSEDVANKHSDALELVNMILKEWLNSKAS